MNSVDLAEIGRRISERRKQLGYTQERLASLMDVSIQMISNLERGVKAIRIDNLIRLSRILNTSVDYILTGTQTCQEVNDLAARIAGLSAENRKTVEVLVDHFSQQ